MNVDHGCWYERNGGMPGPRDWCYRHNWLASECPLPKGPPKTDYQQEREQGGMA